jgi:hypothetical protein
LTAPHPAVSLAERPFGRAQREEVKVMTTKRRYVRALFAAPLILVVAAISGGASGVRNASAIDLRLPARRRDLRHLVQP